MSEMWIGIWVGLLAAPVGAIALITGAYLVRLVGAASGVVAYVVPHRGLTRGVAASVIYGSKKAWMVSTGSVAVAFIYHQEPDRRNQMLAEVGRMESVDINDLIGKPKEHR